MAIISESNPRVSHHYENTIFRYAMIYVAVTFFVLLFLNIYTTKTSQVLFNKNKETAMIEKCLFASAGIADLELFRESTVSTAVSQLGITKTTRMLVTNQSGLVIYDSLENSPALGKYALLPEIVAALRMNDVFTGDYHAGTIQSRAATPVLSYGTLIGCVYMMEEDTAQGGLMQSLQNNILIITLILELALIIFSVVFSNAFSRRLRRIMASMRIIREGDYSHKVIMGGHDELTILGEEFNDLTERLQTSENKRRQFVSDASHELKTPLASIKLLTDSILQNDMDMGTIREFVGDIGNEADRLNRMSQKLLSLSKIESQADGDCEIILMAPTVERAVRMLSAIAMESGIQINLDLQNDCPILILEDDLYQIAFNLFENGIKYNIPGGSLNVTLLRQEDNGVLQITDTGMGIPEESLSHIFERFYRVDKARSRKSGGSGLGLSIVRNMVERNHGEITVESTVGEGTTFTVSFPAFDFELGDEDEEG